MSSRRSRNITKEEINDLVLKLQSLLPQHNQRRNQTLSASKVLNETCTYIKGLQKEVDDQSERLSQLLDSVDTTGIDVDLIRRLFQQ
ncbi:transcription factor PRE4-like [Fagus crenata]